MVALEVLEMYHTRFTTAQTFLALMSSLTRSDYNVALSLFGLLGGLIRKKEVVSFYFVFVAFSIIPDIIWCATFGPTVTTKMERFCLVMSILNLLVKFFSLPFVHKLNLELPADTGAVTFVTGLGLPATPSFSLTAVPLTPRFLQSNTPYQAL